MLTNKKIIDLLIPSHGGEIKRGFWKGEKNKKNPGKRMNKRRDF